MKIYMIGGTSPKVKCGVKDYTLELETYLRKKNVDVVQINEECSEAKLTDWKSVNAYRKVVNNIKKAGGKILHIEYPAKAYEKSIGINLAPAIARVNGLKVVFTTHEYSNRSFLGRLRQIPSFIFSNEIITVEPQFEEDIKKIPLCRKKVQTIRIGSNIPKSDASDERIAQLHSKYSPDGKKVMSYFGFINEYKCFLELIDAIKILKDKNRLNSRLLIIGELNNTNEYHAEVLRKITEYGLDDDIFITGYIKNGVGDYLKASDFAVLPFYYGISVRNGSFLAAYQEGIDIISTKGKSKFPYEDLYLMKDNKPETMAEAIEFMQSNSLKQKQRNIDFGWSLIAEEHIKLYKKLANES